MTFSPACINLDSASVRKPGEADCGTGIRLIVIQICSTNEEKNQADFILNPAWRRSIPRGPDQ
jgi:hypothetical protein